MKRRLLLILPLLTAFGLRATAQTSTPVTVFNFGSVWKYLDNGTNQDTAWRAAVFPDGGWASGPGKLGYADGATTVVSYGPDASNKYITTYFRKRFSLTGTGTVDSIRMSAVRDDGFIMYLNGVEIWRLNMPDTGVNYLTWASTTIDGADESTPVVKTFPKTIFAADSNTLAVELHQRGPTSSDLGWDLKLETAPTPDTAVLTSVLLPVATSWQYLDSNLDLSATGWKTSAYADTAYWKTGTAQLGYGDGDEATPISYGPNASNKYTTAYFRKRFAVDSTPDFTSFTFNGVIDDGAVVYLDGTEIYRYNMPTGAVAWSTFSTADAENAAVSFTIDDSLLAPGAHLIAVEVHQRSLSSSDLSFSLQLTGEFDSVAAPPPPPVVLCPVLDSTHISRFTSVLPSAQVDTLRIPSTHTFQLLSQTGEAYDAGTPGTMPGVYDFTGYVPIAGSSTNGYLSINHEGGAAPAAGVSMLQLSYNSATKLWTVNERDRVDFSGVGGTGRNCSGTVTPWGTIITSEETLPTADVNLDGYQDIGYNVEIDPVTHAIRDQNGDGTPDKLWKLGRMSHENVVVSPDSMRVYEGADEGSTGFVFKFVAAVPGRLDSGALYALKLNTTVITAATSGTWVPIPNSTPTQCNNVRSAAAALGATNFNGVEDCEISPLDGKVYFTSKSASRVYRFLDADTTLSQFEIFVGEASTLYNIKYTATDSASEQWRSGNDNLTFDDEGNLYVLQDGGRNHIWMVKPCHSQATPAVELFAVTPAGCEPTGMTFSPDYRFMFVSFQEPDNNLTTVPDATGNAVAFNKSSAVVIARKEVLGGGIMPPLALHFTDFNAAAANGTVRLDWGFVSDAESVRFSVERATNAAFETVATMDVATTPSREAHFNNAVPASGRAAYRIRAATPSGAVVYSPVRSVDAGFGIASGLQLTAAYPNPASTTFHLGLSAPAAAETRVRVYNSAGLLVLEHAQAIPAGATTLTLPVESLPAGQYAVQVIAGAETVSARFVK